MWEIFVIIARHIQTYMNAELFLLGLMAICFCIPCGYNLYRPHLVISKTKNFSKPVKIDYYENNSNIVNVTNCSMCHG